LTQTTQRVNSPVPQNPALTNDRAEMDWAPQGRGIGHQSRSTQYPRVSAPGVRGSELPNRPASVTMIEWVEPIASCTLTM
jgi:hypothetical protein